MGGQRIERLGHVPVAQVPGDRVSAEHRAVILFGVLHQPRVLLGVEELLGGNPTVAASIFSRSLAQFLELAHRLVLAWLAQPEARRVAISLRVLAEIFEA